jgi:RimJ/RimL family protein N-acetyltransferase
MINQKQWFESLNSHNPPNDLMFGITTKDNKLLGVCGLTYINWKNSSAEASIYIGDSDWQGKGVGKESLIMLLDFGFREVGFHRIWAEIYEFNEASIRLFENVGFKREGLCRDVLWRQGKWNSSFLYSILHEEFRGNS